MPKSAAEATPPAGNRFVEFDEFIDYQLNKTSKSIQSTDVLVGVVGAILGVILYLFLFILADHWLVTGGLGPWFRIACWSVGTGALGYWVTTRLVRPLNSRVNVLFAARQIERTQPGLKSSLLTLTDLKQSGRASAGHILGSLEKRAAVGLSKADVEEAVDRSTLMTYSYALLFLLATFCGYALFSPKSILQSAWRAFAPFTSTGVATRTRIDRVNPGDAEVPALAHLDIEVETSGQAPQEATLYYTTADGAFVDEALPLRDTGEGLRRYRGTLIGPDGRGLRQNLTYHVVAGDARSENYSVKVVQSPSAIVDGVDYEYLPYTGVSNKSEPGGAIDAWEGTRVTVNATANRKVKSAMLLFSDTEDTSVKAEELPMLVSEGTKLKVSWQLALRNDGSFPRFYRVQLVTEENHQDPQPTLQPLNIRPDLPPRVELLYPKSDIEAPVNGTVEIAYKALDPDFKLRSVVLNLEHDGQVLVSSPRLFTGPPDEESRQGTHKLRLAELNLAAGSRLTYWIEARDNLEPFAGRSGNRSVTPRLNIDLVAPKPPAETKKQEEQASKDAQDALEQAQRDESQPAGAEDKGGDRSDGAQGGSEAKPSDDPAPNAEQRPGTESDPGTKPENATPGENQPPMPGDSGKNAPNEQQPPQEQQQPANGTQQQPGRENTGEKQEGQDGAGSEKARPGESKPGAEQRTGDQGRERNGSQGSNSEQKGNDGQRSGQKEQAPDDTQIQKLIDWHKKQTERDEAGKKPGEADPSKSNDSRPQDDGGKPGEKNPDGRSPQAEPGADPSSPMKGQEEGASGKPGDKRDGPQENKTSKNDGAKPDGETTSKGEPGGTPSGDPMQKPAGKGEQPSPDNRQGTESGKPGTEESPSTSPDQKNQPGTTGDPSQKNATGEQAPQPSDNATPGETGAKPDASQKPGATQKPGDPSADQTENNAQTPMGDKGTPGEKSPSNDRQPGKQDDAKTGAKGQESPDGKSGDRTQQGEQKPGAQEKPGNSSQKPTGQNDDMGTREQGMGDPGSSKPSDSGGQKSAGQGEAGKNGASSKTGEKSGTGKSENGSKTEQPGSKEGGDSKGDGGSKQDDGSAKGSGQSDKTSNSPMSDSPQDGSQKPGEKGGDDKSSQGQDSGKRGGDDKQGGGDKAGGDQKQGGDQKGGDQKQGAGDQKQGDQKGAGQDSKDGGGQSSKSGGESAAGNQSGAGEAGDPKPGMSSGSKPGAGGAGSSGPGAAPAEGSHGQGSGGESTPEAANLENRKKATNLALKRLQETLERGAIDPELQKELGFTDDELRTFMDRLEERLADNGDDNSPEAQARRRQFEQLLKGIDLQTETSKRAAGTGEGPSTSGFSTSGRTAPAEYRAAEKRYRESLNKKK